MQGVYSIYGNYKGVSNAIITKGKDPHAWGDVQMIVVHVPRPCPSISAAEHMTSAQGHALSPAFFLDSV